MPRRSARAPRLATLAAILFFSTVLFSHPTPAFSQTNHLYVVCKEPNTLVCIAWPVDFITPNKARELYETNGRKCGLSNLRPIPPHRWYIAVKWFHESMRSKVFCKTSKVRVTVPVLFDLQVSRVRRQTGYHPRGRYRGQTQSQYLSVDRGNGKDEGKAEAHSAADSSRAIVSGNSGMGQAQSQTIYDPSCEDCLDRSDIDAANLSYKPPQRITSGINGKSPGVPYGPGQSTGGSYGPGQSPGNGYGTGQIPYGQGQTPTGTNVPGQSTGGSYGPGQTTGGLYGPGQSPSGAYGPGQTPGSSYSPGQTSGGFLRPEQSPGGQYGSGQPTDNSHGPGQTTGGAYGPGQSPGGSHTSGQTQPGAPSTAGNQPGGIYGTGQTPGGSYGPGQTPGGTFIPTQSTGGIYGPQGGQSSSGSNRPDQTTSGTTGPERTRGGSYIPGQTLGGTYGPDQSQGGTYGPSQTPGGTYGPVQTLEGAYGPVQSTGGTYGPGQSPGGAYYPGQSTGGTNGLGQTPGRPYGPGQSSGGTYRPGQSQGGGYGPGQSPGGIYGPGQSAGTTYGPEQGGPYIPGQSSGAPGRGQSPGGYVPGGSNVQGQLPGGSHVQGQLPGGSNVQGQLPGGSNVQGQLPGGSNVQGQLPGGSNVQGQLPGGLYLQGTSSGGQMSSGVPQGGGRVSGGTQSPGGFYPPSQLPGGHPGDGLYRPEQSPGGSNGQGAYTPGQYTGGPTAGTNQPGFISQPSHPGNIAGQMPGTSTSDINQSKGPGYVSTGNQQNGPRIQPGSLGVNGLPGQTNGINWPLLSSLLPGAPPGSTYFCCVVSPGNNAQTGLGPSNTYFGIPGPGGQTQFPNSNSNFGLGPYNSGSGTTRSNNGLNPQSNFGSTQPGNQANYPNLVRPMTNGFNGQPQQQNPNGPYGTTGQDNLPNGNGVPNILQSRPNDPYGSGNQNNLINPNGPHGTGNIGQNIPYGSGSGRGNLQNPLGTSTSGQNAPIGSVNIGQNGMSSPGSYGMGNTETNGAILPIGSTGQNAYPDRSSTTGITGQYIPGKSGPSGSTTQGGTFGPGSTGANVPSFGTGNAGQNPMLPGGQYGTATGPNSMLPSGPYGTGTGPDAGGLYGTTTGQNSILPSGTYGTTSGQTPLYGPGSTPYETGNGGQNNLQLPNQIGNGGPNSGMASGDHNLIPNNLQTPMNQYGQGNNGQNVGMNGPQSTGQYLPGTTGQNVSPNLGGPRSTGTNVPYGPGNVGQNLGQYPNGQTGPNQNNLMPPNNYGTGQNNYQPGANNQQSGFNNGIQGSNQQNVGQINGNGVGAPQNVIDPNSISSSFDDYDSEAQATVAQSVNGTTALAASKGGNKNGRAQTQVEGTYTGTGSFSANAEISDDNKAAQSHVSGSKKGASSSAEGRGRKNKSQASVDLGSETGSILTDSQSSGDMHSSSSQVQGSVKGGMADAQAKGPGSTSSQAQIGFTPYKDEDKKAHDALKTPFEGGGSASAQTSGRMGTSQSQLRGTFKYGITYNGAAQAGSSLDKDAVFSNLLPFDKINVFDDKNININVDTVTTEKLQEITASLTEKYDVPVPTTTQTPANGEDTTEHTHSDHHKSSEEPNSTTRPPPEGNRRSFSPNYNTNGADYEYSTDKDDNQQEDYDIDDGFGTDAADTGAEQSEYTNYDELNRESEHTHQSLQSPSKKDLKLKQTTGGNTQHIILGSLNNHDARVIQKNSELPDQSKIYQPGERVPGMGGYTIPVGFTGSVKSVASKENTYVVGSKYSPSQAQTVTLTPGTGKVKYVYPNHYGQNVNPKDLRSLYNSKADDNRYVSVSKSVTRDLDNENNIRRQYSHTYYTKSSSCGYFTFTCTMVSSAEGKKKVCKPKIPTNPDGTPMRC